MDDLLDLGSDKALRHQFFTKESLAHPAKLHLGILRWVIEEYTAPGESILDPMAGIGSLAYAALSQRNVILREIEPGWLAMAHENAACILRAAGLFAGSIDIGQADARQPWNVQADHIIFSPPYGCRSSSNSTSRHYVSHKVYQLAKLEGVGYSDRWDKYVKNPTPGSAGSMNFFYGEHPAQIGHWRGTRYWNAMRDIYGHAWNALRPGGYMVLIIKDHIAKGVHIRVVDQTIDLCRSFGFSLIERHSRLVHPLSLWQRRRKERGEPIIEHEDIIVLRRNP